MRREADEIDLTRKVGLAQETGRVKRHGGGDSAGDALAAQHGPGVKRADDAAQHALRLVLHFVAEEREQVMQVERSLRLLHQRAIGAPRLYVGVSPCRIGRHLVKKHADAFGRAHAVLEVVGAKRPRLCAAREFGIDRSLQDGGESRGGGSDSESVAHARPLGKDRR